jgi:hypothetical protein
VERHPAVPARRAQQGPAAARRGPHLPGARGAFVCEPFEIPKHWPRSYGLDVGWNRTAAIFGAYDRETDTGYVYSEHYQGEAEPAVHAAAIKARGDSRAPLTPRPRARSQVDGRKLMQEYREQGLELTRPPTRSRRASSHVGALLHRPAEGVPHLPEPHLGASPVPAR